jgi:hypothetical protein
LRFFARTGQRLQRGFESQHFFLSFFATAVAAYDSNSIAAT